MEILGLELETKMFLSLLNHILALTPAIGRVQFSQVVTYYFMSSNAFLINTDDTCAFRVDFERFFSNFVDTD